MSTFDYQVLDTWMAKPPCMLDKECSNYCPYYHDCWGDDDFDDMDDMDDMED